MAYILFCDLLLMVHCMYRKLGQHFIRDHFHVPDQDFGIRFLKRLDILSQSLYSRNVLRHFYKVNEYINTLIPILPQGQIWLRMLLYEKKVKQRSFQTVL